MLRERIRRNISRKLAGEVGSRLVSFVFNLVMARGLGASVYGRYNYAYAFAGLVALCGELGINTLITRQVAHDRSSAPTLLRSFAPLRLFTIALVALSTVMLALGSTDRSRLPEIALMSAFMAANALLDYHSAIFSAFERMGQDALMRIATRIAVSAAGIAAVLLGAPLLSVIAMVTLANILAAIGGFAWRRRLGLTFGATFDLAFIRATLASLVPMASSSIAGVLYFYMDSLALAGLGFSDAAIGQYSGASRILEASHALPLVIVGAIFPVAAELSRGGDPAVLAPFFTRVTRICLVLGAPLAAVSAVIAPLVARLLYGPGYTETGPALALLALSAPLYYSNLIAFHLFIAQGRLWTTAIIRGGAVAAKLGVLVLASRWVGAKSPAVGMLVADSALFLLLLAYRRRQGLSEPGERSLLLAVSGSLALSLFSYLATRGQGMAVQACAVGLTYLVALPALRRAGSRMARLRAQGRDAAIDPASKS
jgi:O-antigen/teichoic acid export membrane protein